MLQWERKNVRISYSQYTVAHQHYAERESRHHDNDLVLRVATLSVAQRCLHLWSIHEANVVLAALVAVCM